MLKHEIMSLAAFFYGSNVYGRLQPADKRRVAARKRINLLHSRLTRRKRDACEERYQKLAVVVRDARRNCVGQRREPRNRVRNLGESDECRKRTRRNVNLPDQVLATVRDVDLIANNNQVKRIHTSKTTGPRGVNRKIRKISNQLHGELATLGIGYLHLLA